jgi:hypothetical protein
MGGFMKSSLLCFCCVSLQCVIWYWIVYTNWCRERQEWL